MVMKSEHGIVNTKMEGCGRCRYRQAHTQNNKSKNKSKHEKIYT